MNRIVSFLPVALAIGLSVSFLPANAATVFWANVNASGTLVRGQGAGAART